MTTCSCCQENPTNLEELQKENARLKARNELLRTMLSVIHGDSERMLRSLEYPTDRPPFDETGYELKEGKWRWVG